MKITACDFFMITVGEEDRPQGHRGSVVRHYNYELAIREADRLCKVNNGEEVFVLGVVASVKPKPVVVDTFISHR